jgi:hypothetical protein
MYYVLQYSYMYSRGTLQLARGVVVLRVGLPHDCQGAIAAATPTRGVSFSCSHIYSRGRRLATATLARGIVVLRISLPHGYEGHGAVCRDSTIGIEAGWDLSKYFSTYYEALMNLVYSVIDDVNGRQHILT